MESLSSPVFGIYLIFIFHKYFSLIGIMAITFRTLGLSFYKLALSF